MGISTETLGQLIRDLSDLRSELRELGNDAHSIELATERLVRERWPKTDERFWPAHLTLARCAYCDGTGLVIHRNVKNRLGGVVDEGVPCRCPQGSKFLPKAVNPEADFQQAGKVQKPLKRFGR